MIKTVMASALVVALGSFAAHAAEGEDTPSQGGSTTTAAVAQGEGTVKFEGKVIDAPCSIASESQDQTIDFGQISKSHLSNGGTSEQKDVKIQLRNCDITNVTKGVKFTFSGNTVSGADTELATAGPTNTAIAMSGYGAGVKFGTATDHIQLQTGSNEILFKSWVKQAAGKAVGEGDFTAVTNFNLSYE